LLGAACLNGAKNFSLDGSIDVAAAGDGFEIVCGSVANGLRAPRLIEKFEKLETPQPLWPISPQSHRPE
jgi:hypothetical protein